jgi:hypothetical protein
MNAPFPETNPLLVQPLFYKGLKFFQANFKEILLYTIIVQSILFFVSTFDIFVITVPLPNDYGAEIPTPINLLRVFLILPLLFFNICFLQYLFLKKEKPFLKYLQKSTVWNFIKTLFIELGLLFINFIPLLLFIFSSALPEPINFIFMIPFGILSILGVLRFLLYVIFYWWLWIYPVLTHNISGRKALDMSKKIVKYSLWFYIKFSLYSFFIGIILFLPIFWILKEIFDIPFLKTCVETIAQFFSTLLFFTYYQEISNKIEGKTDTEEKPNNEKEELLEAKIKLEEERQAFLKEKEEFEKNRLA